VPELEEAKGIIQAAYIDDREHVLAEFQIAKTHLIAAEKRKKLSGTGIASRFNHRANCHNNG
jgi:hypothetical protein